MNVADTLNISYQQEGKILIKIQTMFVNHISKNRNVK